MFDLLVIVVFMYGLLFGSYFNVVIARVPQGHSVLSPSSRCPRCYSAIHWYHNIPILSYVYLKGRCGRCYHPIGIKYPLVELGTGVLAVVAFLVATVVLGDQADVKAFAFSWLVICMIPIFYIDIKYYLIPDGVVLPGVVFGLTAAVLSPSMIVIDAFVGAILASSVLFLFGWLVSKILKREALGFGDVKLMAMVGAFTGADGALVTIVLASIVGLVITIILKVIRGESRDIPLPFGPYIIAAVLPVFLWKNTILNSYFEFIYSIAGNG